jgi:hypothetical protein
VFEANKSIMIRTTSSMPYGTNIGGQVSRAGLFYGLSTGEFCPLPLFPSPSLGARGFPHR